LQIDATGMKDGAVDDGPTAVPPDIEKGLEGSKSEIAKLQLRRESSERIFANITSRVVTDRKPAEMKTMQRNHIRAGSPERAAAPGNQLATDEALVRAIERGETGAMQAFFARYSVRVYRFLARLLGDAASAEDLVADVFLAVWRKAHRFEGRSQVSTWLLGIARKKALSHLGTRAIDHLEEERPYATGELCPDLEEENRGVLFRQALTRLSPTYREIIDLAYYHERSIEEVSKILRIPEKRVRVRMFYARKRLADVMGVTDRVRISQYAPKPDQRDLVGQCSL
jgi:RNA polymerase sigma-70 factor, ECF subfamily